MSDVYEWLTNAEAGESCPAADVRGIDVSHHQGVIDWGPVAAQGIQFAFIKATEGARYKDPRFAANWAATQHAGIVRGAYHYLRPELDGRQQARHFLDVVGRLERGDLPPVLDVEEHSGLKPTDIAEQVDHWLTDVRTELGREPIVYTGGGFWRNFMADTPRFAGQPLWVAHYTTGAPPQLFGGWKAWTFWQHSDAGTVAGIAGRVDLDRFAGARSRLQALTEDAVTA